MTDGANTASSRPACSTFLSEGIYPTTPKEVPANLESANDYARNKATIEMCQRCMGKFGLLCMLPGPQHPDQNIIPDITPDILTGFKKDAPKEVLMWIDRILKGKTSLIENPKIPRRYDASIITRTAMFAFGFPQDGPTISREMMRSATFKEGEPPESPPVIINPSGDQGRGVSAEVLMDIGYEPG